jgi:hypothetical protein
MNVDETVMWLIGLAVTVAAGFLTIWWRVEAKQDRALCALRKEHNDSRKENNAEHGTLHEKVDDVRDKIEAIWIHLVKEAGKK